MNDVSAVKIFNGHSWTRQDAQPKGRATSINQSWDKYQIFPTLCTLPPTCIELLCVVLRCVHICIFGLSHMYAGGERTWIQR